MKCPECGAVMPRIRNIGGLHDCLSSFLVKKEEAAELTRSRKE